MTGQVLYWQLAIEWAASGTQGYRRVAKRLKQFLCFATAPIFVVAQREASITSFALLVLPVSRITQINGYARKITELRWKRRA